MRWPFRLKPHADELLSSFLVRAAHTHGLAPYRFCAYHFPDSPVWNRDIDRSASDAFLESIAVKADLPFERVVGMTLRSAAATLGPYTAGGAGPWVNTVGVYHRLRRRWGLQYCPVCLAEHPVFYRSWRLSFVVVCNQHQVRLQDACPHCDAPLAIHRQQLSVRLCHACSRPLSEMRAGLRFSLEALSRAQSRYESAWARDRSEIGHESVAARDLFQGARVVAGLFIPPASDFAASTKARRSILESARVEQRAQVFSQLESLLAHWPDRFITAARENHLTQRSFVRRALPQWLAAVVDRLPEGSVRIGATHRGRHSLRARLESSRRNAAEWRTIRAELLWRAATQ
jgi:hypothetical protein